MRLSVLSLILAGFVLPMPTLARDAEVVHAGLVAPDIAFLVIEEGDIIQGEIVPYTFNAATDVIEDKDPTESGARWIKRNGQTIGSLVGKDDNLRKEFDQFVGETADRSLMGDRFSYSLTPVGGGATLTPIDVYRKSTPINQALVGEGRYDFPYRHYIYLTFAEALPIDGEWLIYFADPLLEPYAFTNDPRSNRSEAVHVNQVGFAPLNPGKVAMLSCWMGDGGALDYPTGMTFELLDEDGQTVYTGNVVRSKLKTTPEDNRALVTYPDGDFNYCKTDVYEMDFSDFETPGTYRVYVNGIGTSYPFEIGDGVWDGAFQVSMKGLYHQRSGIELGPPYTDYIRPRPMHPDDGNVIHETTADVLVNPDFASIIAGETANVVPNWGGYMDAGDWDRRIQHLSVSYNLLDLAELFPLYFGSVDLNIPESGNELPDVIDEALFNIDFFRRMQTPEGGIRGGIESAAHPRTGEPSWHETLRIYAFSPDPWSSYLYAATAAKAAAVLVRYDETLAAVYEESAVAAMNWAELQSVPPGKENTVGDARNWAAAELFRLTGDTGWHEIFVDSTMMNPSQGGQILDRQHEAIWTYCITKREGVDEDLQDHARSRFPASVLSYWVNSAVHKSAFHFSKHPWAPHGWSNGTAPQSERILHAFVLTGQERYLEAAVLSTGIVLGANPNNRVQTVGLGEDSVKNPLHLDSRYSAQPAPIGITVYGSAQNTAHDWVPIYAMSNDDERIYPDYLLWPVMEYFHDIYLWPPQTEFTVHQMMGPVSYVWGFLAAMDGSAPPDEPLTPGDTAGLASWQLYWHP